MKVMFVYYDDWTAMYVDGNLLLQNHQLNGVTVAQGLAEHQRLHPHTDLNIMEVLAVGASDRDEWELEKHGSAPESLEQISYDPSAVQRVSTSRKEPIV